MRLFAKLISILVIVSFVDGQNVFTCPHNYYGKYPDISNCMRYWECSSGRPTRLWCPAASYYDHKSSSCIAPSRPQCMICHETGLHYVKVDCKRYRMCVMGTPFDQKCLDGTYFDETARECVLVEEGQDECPFTPCLGTGLGFSFQRNPNKCEEYYLCENEKMLFNKTCTRGTWFGTSTCEPNKPYECMNYNSAALEAPRSVAFYATYECPNEGAAIIPSEGDCAKYSVCSNGKVIEERTCTKGLHFSADLGVCVQPEAAFCM